MPLNPSKVKRQVALLSSLNVDKIIRVFEGSFNAATDCTTVNFTLFGFPNPIQAFRIPHGLPRPVFAELMWSLNNSTYIDGGTAGDGSGNAAIAFSDSTYIYIPRPVNSGTVYYKVICSWIDNYDSTNPAVDSIMYRKKPISFDSRLNYQKIYDQNVLTSSSTEIKPVPHSLGYRPNAKVFFEAIPGQVWPLNFGGTGNPFIYDDRQIEAQLFIGNSAINIAVQFPASASGARRIWYRIYYDGTD